MFPSTCITVPSEMTICQLTPPPTMNNYFCLTWCSRILCSRVITTLTWKPRSGRNFDRILFFNSSAYVDTAPLENYCAKFQKMAIFDIFLKLSSYTITTEPSITIFLLADREMILEKSLVISCFLVLPFLQKCPYANSPHMPCHPSLPYMYDVENKCILNRYS